MGLRLTGKGSIWDAIGNAAGDVASGVAGTVEGLGKGLYNTITGDIVEPTRQLIGEATGNQAAANAAAARASADQQASLPYQLINQVANLGGAGYNLFFKSPLESLTGNEQGSNNSFQAGMHEFNQTIPGQIVAPIEHGISNIAEATNPQGPNAQDIRSQIGLDPNASIGHEVVNSGINAALLAAGANGSDVASAASDAIKSTPEMAAAIADRATPLNEVGAVGKNVAPEGASAAENAVPKIDAAKAKPVPEPAPESLPLTQSIEDAIHAQNPLNPQLPTEGAVAPTLQPTPAELAASSRAAEALDNSQQPIDFTQVEGAGKRLNQAITDRANTLRSMDDGAKGGQMIKTEDGYKRISEHSPFYSKYYEEYGRKPSIAAYKEEAVRELRTGSDAESQNYQNLVRHSKVEQELKDYQLADRQSGYNKVKTKAVEGQPKKGMNSAQLEKFQSPEYAARLDAWQKLENARSALNDTEKQIKQLDRVRSKINNPDKLAEASQTSMQVRMKRNLLQNLVRQYGDTFTEATQNLEDKYGDTILRKPGARKLTTVSGQPATGTFAIDDAGKVKLTETGKSSISTKAEEPYQGYQPTNPGEPYTGPNLNEGAFDPAEMDRLMKQENAAPGQGLPQRSLAGDEAAFRTLEDGGSMDDALKAYKEASGADDATAKSAINYIAEEAALPDTEALLSRNPSYQTWDHLSEPRNLEDVNTQVRAYSRTLGYLRGFVHDLYKSLDDHDQAILEKSRDVPAQDLIHQAHDANGMEQLLSAMDQAQNDMHEIRRSNGADTPYRENYRAGLHTTMPEALEPEEMRGPFKDELSRQLGYSRPRNISNYEDIPGMSDRVRQHANIMEDFDHDVGATLGYAHDRAIQLGVNAVHGGNATEFGAPDAEHPTQLNGTTNVFSSKEIAKQWNKITPDLKDRPWYLKPYDATTSAIVQAVVQNPLIHGSNQLAQAFEAAGQVSHIGIDGGGRLGVNLAHAVTPEDLYQFYKEGNHSPDYNKNSTGLVARATKGVTNLNKQSMAAIELKLRVGVWETLRDGGLDATDARDTIDRFMGSDKVMGNAAQNFGFFWHYFRTTTGSLIHTAAHPISGSGVIVNGLVVAGVVYGFNQAWKAFTGNNNAYVHTPGNIGITQDIYRSARDIYDKHYLQAAGIVTNRVNPVLKETASQVLNKDMTFGGPLAPNGTAAERLQHAAGLTPETSAISTIASNKKAPAEAAENFFGAYTPHAKGYEASGKIKILNTDTTTPEGKVIPPKAGNGLQQRDAYFSSVEGARNGLPAARQRVYDAITAGETDGNGNPIGMNDKQAQAHYQDLYANPDILKAITKQKQDYAKKTGTELDPLYAPNISDAQRAEYAHLQSLAYKGDDYIQQADANKDWLKPMEAARADYFSKQDFSNAPLSQRVQPPKFDESTQSLLDQVNNLSGTDKVQFIIAHPELQAAYDAIAKYTNDRRTAEGNTAFKLFPEATPEIEGIIKEYNAVPLGGGSKGGNKFRAQWIQANPDKYAQMQSYYAQTAEWELANSAGQDRFQGASPSQEELKSAYDLGKYDIAKSGTPGNYTYAINPASANLENNPTSAFASYGSSRNSAGFTSGQVRAARNFYNYTSKKHSPKIRTLAQNRASLPRFNDSKIRGRSKVARITPKTGKLRIKALA